MSAMAIEDALCLDELDAAEMDGIEGGIPWAPIGYAVAAYLAKTVGDNWGAFKEGVEQGFEAVWN